MGEHYTNAFAFPVVYDAGTELLRLETGGLFRGSVELEDATIERTEDGHVGQSDRPA